jgi:hypothetical protein
VPAWAPSEQTVFVGPRATTFSVVCEACRAAGDRRPLAGTLALGVDRASLHCRKGHRLRVVRAVPLPALP